MKKLTLFATFFIFQFSFFIANSQTTITGPSVSGHWTLAGSPYNVQNSIFIPSGSTLTIDPGVTVNFQTSFTPYLLVQGQLIAVGNATDTIYFTATDTTNGFHGIRFVDLNPINDTSKIEYCKIQYGKAQGATYTVQNGGALLFDHWSKVVVSHNYISNCNSMSYGGAIYCDSGSSPVITYNTIYNNYVVYNDGGGISIRNGSTPLIAYNTIMDNYAGSGGGGVFAQYTYNYLITQNTIMNNSAADFAYYGGGGIYTQSSSGTISYNDVSGNYVYNGEGGGIYIKGDSASILDNTVSYNTCLGPGYGGGITCAGTNLDTITDNIIANNFSGVGGGVCLMAAGATTISNNTIINNTAQYLSGNGTGGGIYCSGTNPLIINTTFANNYSYNGGGIYCNNASNPESRNCVYWGDIATNSGNELFQNDQPSTPNYYYSDIQGGQASFGLNGNFYYGTYSNNISSDPLFNTPSAGQGIGFDGLFADWTLQNSSPAIDTADPLYSYYPPLDLGGNSRIVVCRADMGAYENQYGISSPLQLHITAGSNSICIGDSTTLAVSGASAYTWSPSSSLNFSNIAGPIASPTVTTTYTVIGRKGVCEAMDTITIFVKPLPTVSFTGEDTTCYGTPVTITVYGGGTYLWSNTEVTSNITVNPAASTTYSVAVTKNGCTKDSSFTLTVNPLPVINITKFVDTLTAKGAKTYVWSTGSTNDTTIIHQDGTYYVTGTDSNGCSFKDSIIVLTTDLINEISKSPGVSVYPIPSAGNITVTLNGKGYVSIKISDELGREIYCQPIDPDKQNQNLNINLTSFSNGIYMMQVTSANGVSAKKIVIQK